MILCMSLMIVGLLLVPGAYSFTTKTAPCRIKTSIYVKQKHIKNACSITPLPESNSRFNIAIDGVEADLGKFSLMLFKQILQQAKNDPTGNQMVFKGYRPGVIPPQYLRKYHAYAMEQTCRETVKEGFSQNGYSVAELEGGEEDCSFVSFKFFPKVEVKKVSRKRKDVAALKAKIAAGEVEAEPEMDQLLANTFDESVKLGWEVSERSEASGP